MVDQCYETRIGQSADQLSGMEESKRALVRSGDDGMGGHRWINRTEAGWGLAHGYRLGGSSATAGHDDSNEIAQYFRARCGAQSMLRASVKGRVASTRHKPGASQERGGSWVVGQETRCRALR